MGEEPTYLVKKYLGAIKMKKILVAAGTSVNKMNGVASTIERMCLDRNVVVEVQAKNVYDINLSQENPDVIVLVGPNKLDTNIPTVDGVSFMTTIGMDQAVDEIISKIS